MSQSPILEVWPEGIAAARIPANNNVRLITALLLNAAISATTAAQPGSPAEGDVYILPASPTGSNWAAFFEDDVVIYYNATWTAYTPPEGLRKFVEDEGEDWQFVGSSSGGWAPAGTGGGGIQSVVAGAGISVDDTDPDNPIVTATGSSELLTLITEASAFTADPATHAGRSRMILAGGDVEFDTAEGYSVGECYTIRATATLELLETGMTITPPADGTLEMNADMTVTVVITSSTTGFVVGQTVAA